jgi:hypothetical protein
VIVGGGLDVYASGMNEFRRTRTSALRAGLPLALLCAIALTSGCAGRNVEQAPVPAPPPDRAASLQSDLDELAGGAAPGEAHLLAEAAMAESARLAVEYRMARPALFNNVLVNVGLKKRGLCWHWAEDLFAALRRLPLSSYELHWGIAHRGRLFREHNSLVVTARGESFASGIVLDPWRESGALYWVAVREDRYPWEPR